MTEKLLQYIWQFQHFNRSNLCTTTGEPLSIIFQGILNKNQGPDFTNAKIKVGNTLLAGSVELHIKTSEWQAHGHQHDANYQNVILHVAFEDDGANISNLPTLILQNRISVLLLNRYTDLMNASVFIPCAASIAHVSDITWAAWKERLLAERLTRKSKLVLQYLQQSQSHWEETFWWLLARSFGAKVNADAFEAIARAVPVKILAKQKNNIHQLEALLLGQANLLNENFTEQYPILLQKEYRFLKTKYQLPMVHQPVHFLRMRPGNFPSLRLAQLAMLIYTSSHLFSKVLEAESVNDIKSMLHVTANDYWHYHYRLEEPSAFKKKNIGANMVDTIIINTIVPVLFAYGSYHSNEDYQTKALRWLEALAPEINTITTGFKNLSIACQSAYDSQALLELKNEYCQYKRCLECSVGNFLLRDKRGKEEKEV